MDSAIGNWWRARVPGLVVGTVVGAFLAAGSYLTLLLGLSYSSGRWSWLVGDNTRLALQTPWLAYLIGALQIIVLFALMGLLTGPSKGKEFVYANLVAVTRLATRALRRGLRAGRSFPD